MCEAAAKLISLFVQRHFEINEFIHDHLCHKEFIEPFLGGLTAFEPLTNPNFILLEKSVVTGHEFHEYIPQFNISNTSVLAQPTDNSNTHKANHHGKIYISDKSVSNQKLNSHLLSNKSNIIGVAPKSENNLSIFKRPYMQSCPQKVLSSFSDNSGITYPNQEVVNEHTELNDLNKEILQLSNAYDIINTNTDIFKDSVGKKQSTFDERSDSPEKEKIVYNHNITMDPSRYHNSVLSDLSKFRKIEKKDIDQFKIKLASEGKRKASSMEKVINNYDHSCLSDLPIKVKMNKGCNTLSNEQKYEMLKKDFLCLQR